MNADMSISSAGPQYKNKVLNLYVLIFSENKNIYLHFMSFLHIDMAQVVDILPQVRQEHTYST